MFFFNRDTNRFQKLMILMNLMYQEHVGHKHYFTSYRVFRF